MKWIDIETQQPEIATLCVALCTKGSTWIGFRANGGWYINTNYGQIYVQNDDREKKIEIAYWIPLPSIPDKLFKKLFPNEKEEG
jgi:hypothetical protein